MKSINFNHLMGIVFAALLVAGCASTESEDAGEVSGRDSLSGFDGSVADRQRAEEEEAARKKAEEEAAKLQNVVYFDFDSSTLSPQTRAVLDKQIARLRDTVGTIRLEGHTDERGTREYNIALGERRAKSVADYMALNGISRHRIETVSYGEERPAVFGQNEEAWSKNRRVEIK